MNLQVVSLSVRGQVGRQAKDIGQNVFCENRFHRAMRYRQALMQQQNPVGKTGGQGQIMQHNQNRAAPPHLILQHGHDQKLLTRIKPRHGFIEQKPCCAGGQSPRQ